MRRPNRAAGSRVRSRAGVPGDRPLQVPRTRALVYRADPMRAGTPPRRRVGIVHWGPNMLLLRAAQEPDQAEGAHERICRAGIGPA